MTMGSNVSQSLYKIHRLTPPLKEFTKIGHIIRMFELLPNYLDEMTLGGESSVLQLLQHTQPITTLQKNPGQLVFGRDMIFQYETYHQLGLHPKTETKPN